MKLKKKKKSYQAFPSRLVSKNSSTKAGHGELNSICCQGNADMEKITLYVTPLKNILIFLVLSHTFCGIAFLRAISAFYLCFPRCLAAQDRRKKKQSSPIDGKLQLNESLMCRGDGRSEGLRDRLSGLRPPCFSFSQAGRHSAVRRRYILASYSQSLSKPSSFFLFVLNPF